MSADAESLDIETLHDFLDLHFRELREQREEGIPIFALEHGLDPQECRKVKGTVRGIVPGRRKSWLPYVVHATEIGYNFSGQEYWKTFQEETPGWWEYGNREWLKEKFEQFSDKYGGVEPTGAWADHFSLIAWPVANAILAGDLRNHLVHVLHSIRDALGSQDSRDSAYLGRQIRIRAQSTSHVSRRFVQFAEQERLIGHIANALLSSGHEASQSLIEESALQRIVDELEEEQLTQLEEASRSARASKAAGRRADTVEEAVRALRAALSVQPVGENEYRISLEIPSLEPLLEEDEAFEAVLTKSDATIEGAQRNRLPPRALAVGPTEIRLETWTLPNSRLLEFEDASDEDAANKVAMVLNEHLFDVGCGPWLFKLRKDGRGKNIRSRRVRPGSSYVLAGQESKMASLDLGNPVHIQADGIAGHHVEVENPLSAQEEAAFQKLGFKIKGEIDVWPAGVVPASFDGQEEATWLTTDTPMLGIHSNLAVTQYDISLNGGEAMSTVAAPKEGPVLVQIPGLNVGAHTLTVSVETNSGRQEEQLRIKVRRPERNRGENAKIWPLHVVVASPSASMEELWEAEVGLSAQGPRGRKVEVFLELYPQDGTKPIATAQSEMSLPITEGDWKNFIQKHCLRNSDLVDHFDEAYKAEVTIDGGIIGSKTIPFERQRTLLRWKRIEQEGRRKIQLLDDTDEGPQTQIRWYAPGQPLESTHLNMSGPGKIFGTNPSGGLWHAKAGDYTATRIVPPAETELEWKCEEISTPEEVTRAIHALCLWKNAETRDEDSIALQETVLSRLQEMVVLALCGTEWMEKEKRWLANPTEENREDLEAMVEKVPGQANPVREALADLDTPPGNEEMKTWIKDNRWLQKRRTIDIGDGARVGDLDGLSRSGLARISIRTMEDASVVAEWKIFDDGIKQLVDNPDMARTARAVVLARHASTTDVYEAELV